MRTTIVALSFVFTMVFAATSTSEGGRTAYSGAYYLHELKASMLTVLEQNQTLINDGGRRPKSSRLLPDTVFARCYDLFMEIVGDGFSIHELGRDSEAIGSALAIMLQAGRVTITRLKREIEIDPGGARVRNRFTADAFGRQVVAEFERRTGVCIEQTKELGEASSAPAHDTPLDPWRAEDPAFIRVSIPHGR